MLTMDTVSSIRWHSVAHKDPVAAGRTVQQKRY